MQLLPSIAQYCEQRPHAKASGKKQFIPDLTNHPNFWFAFYQLMNKQHPAYAPVVNFSPKVNPYFGYFGYRWHPINFNPNYFHIGVDIGEKIGTPIAAMYDGFLDYSGAANVNGNYIVLKHPTIQTEDGFILHSLYMHCDQLNVKFSLLQKVWREYISKKTNFANIVIPKGTTIATVGNTGNKLGVVPHLHLQVEWIHPASLQRIAVSPLDLLGTANKENLTAKCQNKAEFLNFYKIHQKALKPWTKFWQNEIT